MVITRTMGVVWLCLWASACTRYADAVLPPVDAADMMEPPVLGLPQLARDYGDQGVFKLDVTTGSEQVVGLVEVDDGLAVLLEADCTVLKLTPEGKLDTSFASGGIFRAGNCRGRKLLWDAPRRRLLVAYIQSETAIIQALSPQGVPAAPSPPGFYKFQLSDVTAIQVTSYGVVVAGPVARGLEDNDSDTSTALLVGRLDPGVQNAVNVGFAEQPGAIFEDVDGVKILGVAYDPKGAFAFSLGLSREGGLDVSAITDPLPTGFVLGSEHARIEVAPDGTRFLFGSFAVQGSAAAPWPGVLSFGGPGFVNPAFGEGGVARLPTSLEVQWTALVPRPPHLIFVGHSAQGEMITPQLSLVGIDDGAAVPPFHDQGLLPISGGSGLVPQAALVTSDGLLTIAGGAESPTFALFVAKVRLGSP